MRPCRHATTPRVAHAVSHSDKARLRPQHAEAERWGLVGLLRGRSRSHSVLTAALGYVEGDESGMRARQEHVCDLARSDAVRMSTDGASWRRISVCRGAAVGSCGAVAVATQLARGRTSLR